VKKITITLAVLLQLVIVSRLQAQVDPHFSQYYAYPLWLNPALTGVIDGDSRLTANYKSQWQSISNAYQTAALSGDFRATDKVGVGFNVIDQKAGSAGYNYLAAYGSFGYGISLNGDGTQHLHFGLQAGFINRNFDLGKLEFDDQYNPLTGFDPSIPSNEYFSTTSATIFDAGTGIYYFSNDQSSSTNAFGGVSLFHITQPKDQFATDGLDNTLPMRLTIHGGLRIVTSDFLSLTPHFIYIMQQKAQEKDIGLYSEMAADENNSFILGGMYRFGDAAIADIGYHSDSMTVGLSYDFNVSQLHSITKTQGGLEISLSYTFSHSSEGNSEAPRF
jgi:type IX secretion system PorP/SprF family membrane protein